MKKIIVLLLLALFFSRCKKEYEIEKMERDTDSEVYDHNLENVIDSVEIKKNDSIQLAKSDSIEVAKKVALELSKKSKKFSVFKGDAFSYWPIKNSDSLRKLFYNTFTKEQQYTIAALNRIDTDHIKKRDTLIVPNTFKSAFIDYSPFPRTLDNLMNVPKIIIFSYPIQAYGVYENGNLVKWGPTNMGKKASQTPRGLFFTNWKGRKVRSTVDDEWILNWNFNISNKGGVGWHQYALPGYPASHSCLRLLDADAQWLYNWADQWVITEDKKAVKVKGTPVIVYGDYNFGSKGIWHQLVVNPSITNLSKNDLEELVEPHLTEIYKQQTIREEYNKTKPTNKTKEDSLKIVKDTVK